MAMWQDKNVAAKVSNSEVDFKEWFVQSNSEGGKIARQAISQVRRQRNALY